MESAIIGPIKYLTQLDKEFSTGFHICYVSLVHEYKAYRDFYRTKSRRGEFVILDYSHITPRDIPGLGGLRTFKPAIEYIRPSAVILPDSDLHLKKTVKSAKESIAYFKKTLGDIPVIGMVQGINEEQYKECLDTYIRLSLRYPLIGIALPSSMEKIMSRLDFITEVYQPCEVGFPLYISELFDSLREVRYLNNNEDVHRGLFKAGWSS